MAKVLRHLLFLGFSGVVLGWSANGTVAQTVTRTPAAAASPGFGAWGSGYASADAALTKDKGPATSSGGIGYGYDNTPSKRGTGTTNGGSSGLTPAAAGVVHAGVKVADDILASQQAQPETVDTNSSRYDPNFSGTVPTDSNDAPADPAPPAQANAWDQARQAYGQLKRRVLEGADQVRASMPTFDARLLGNNLAGAVLDELKDGAITAATIRQKLLDAFVEKTTALDSQIGPILSAVPEQIKAAGQMLTGDFMGAVHTRYEWMSRSVDQYLDGKIQQGMSGQYAQPDQPRTSGH